jgi:hypothetical protein
MMQTDWSTNGWPSNLNICKPTSNSQRYFRSERLLVSLLYYQKCLQIITRNPTLIFASRNAERIPIPRIIDSVNLVLKWMLIVNFPGHQDRCWAGIQTRYCSPGRRQQRECAAGEREGQETPVNDRKTAEIPLFISYY